MHTTIRDNVQCLHDNANNNFKFSYQHMYFIDSYPNFGHGFKNSMGERRSTLVEIIMSGPGQDVKLTLLFIVMAAGVG